MEKVVIRRCETYDKDLIRSLIREGMEELGFKPAGKTLIKPNIVYAHRRYATHAYSHPALVEAMVEELKSEPSVKKVTIGERTAVTIPTRFVFAEAGYLKLAKRQGIDCVGFEEDRKVEVRLEKATLHPVLHLAKTLVEADTKVYVPKLKVHASSKMTCTLKLNIGILDQKERLCKHDWRLEEKIADLLEPGYPDFICVDGVEVGQQGELVPVPRHMGALIMGDNPVAVDTICAHLMNFEPTEITHLRIAHERGYGPIDMEEIEVKTDVDMDFLRSRTENLDRKFADLTELAGPIRFYPGHPPGENVVCEGGCYNMLKTAFAIQEAYAPGSLERARPAQIVTGVYEGDLDGDGPIIFVGDCTRVNGRLGGKVFRIGGCPVIVPWFMVRVMAPMLKLKSPFLDPTPVGTLLPAALESYGRKLFNNLRG